MTFPDIPESLEIRVRASMKNLIVQPRLLEFRSLYIL